MVINGTMKHGVYNEEEKKIVETVLLKKLKGTNWFQRSKVPYILICMAIYFCIRGTMNMYSWVFFVVFVAINYGLDLLFSPVKSFIRKINKGTYYVNKCKCYRTEEDSVLWFKTYKILLGDLNGKKYYHNRTVTKELYNIVCNDSDITLLSVFDGRNYAIVPYKVG